MESDESGMEDDEPEPEGLTLEELKLWKKKRARLGARLLRGQTEASG